MFLKIFNPDENGVGEICIRGRNSFIGYLKDEKASQESFDPEGFFHTGDLGKIDSNNFLVITGREKELIITAGGENISPVPIELSVREVLPFVSHAVVIGDGRKYISVLLTLKVEHDFYDRPTNRL